VRGLVFCRALLRRILRPSHLPPKLFRHHRGDEGWAPSGRRARSRSRRREFPRNPPARQSPTPRLGSTSSRADDCLWVRVPSGQSRSAQAGTESCGRRGNAGSELRHRVQIGSLGRRRQIADGHVLNHTAAQRAHLGQRGAPVLDWASTTTILSDRSPSLYPLTPLPRQRVRSIPLSWNSRSRFAYRLTGTKLHEC
jgi:hypothetical protein